jgi:hypothetical protein
VSYARLGWVSRLGLQESSGICGSIRKRNSKEAVELILIELKPISQVVCEVSLLEEIHAPISHLYKYDYFIWPFQLPSYFTSKFSPSLPEPILFKSYIS